MLWPTGARARAAGPPARWRALPAALAASALLAAGCSQQASPGDSQAAARLSVCGGNPQARPDAIVILCSDNGISAHGLRWSGWGSPVATATGAATVNLCEYSDCYNGDYATFPVVVVLSRLSACPQGWKAYGRLQYMFVGRQPFPPGDAAVTQAAAQAAQREPPGALPGMPGPGC